MKEIAIIVVSGDTSLFADPKKVTSKPIQSQKMHKQKQRYPRTNWIAAQPDPPDSRGEERKDSEICRCILLEITLHFRYRYLYL